MARRTCLVQTHVVLMTGWCTCVSGMLMGMVGSANKCSAGGMPSTSDEASWKSSMSPESHPSRVAFACTSPDVLGPTDCAACASTAVKVNWCLHAEWRQRCKNESRIEQLRLKADKPAKHSSVGCKMALSAQKDDAASERACGCSCDSHITGSLSYLVEAMCLLDAQVQHLQLLMQHAAAEIWPRECIANSLCSCCTDSWHSRVLLPAVVVA